MLNLKEQARPFALSRRSDGRWSIELNASYEEVFPISRFPDYGSFVNAPGALLKDEPRTVLRVLERGGGPGDAPAPSFVLKHYTYPLASQLRTWYLDSKAHREFAALGYCRALGIPVVEPVACGVERTRFGSVQSCFLVTRYVEGIICLRDWLYQHSPLSTDEEGALEALLEDIGRQIRKVHVERFFLSRLMAKNILVRSTPTGAFEWFLIDQPYARFCKPKIAARSFQLRDIGAFAGSIYDHGLEGAFEPFFSTYLPDPLGGSDLALRQRAAHGVRIYHNQTLARRLFKMPMRRLKHKIKEWRSSGK